MDHSPEVPTLSFDKYGFASVTKEELAITYLIDSDAEEERLDRWQKLLPRIMDLKNGGKESERQLMN